MNSTWSYGIPRWRASMLWSESGWDTGLRRVVQRRWYLTLVAIALGILGSVWVLSVALYPPWSSWLPVAMGTTALVAFILLLLSLFEQTRADELIDRWILQLRDSFGGRLGAGAAIAWADRLAELLEERPPLQVWITRSLLREGHERLLLLAAERAGYSIQMEPLDAASHMQLAQSLSRLFVLVGSEDPRRERLHRHCLDELVIARQLAPQDPDVYWATIACATRLQEVEIELAARERLTHLCPEPPTFIGFGHALLRHGYAGRAFDLYRECMEEAPETAAQILEAYDPLGGWLLLEK